MATGKSYQNISPGPYEAGMPPVEYWNESSSQTALRGAPVVITSGYAAECGANPQSIRGFLMAAASNGASNGAKKSGYYRCQVGQKFVGTLLTANFTAAMAGSVANLVADSSTWCIQTATSISSVAQVNIIGPAPGFAFGDVNPEVYFTVLDTCIQY